MADARYIDIATDQLISHGNCDVFIGKQLERAHIISSKFTPSTSRHGLRLIVLSRAEILEDW